MSPNVFDPIDPIRYGWNTLRSNLQFFFVLMITVAVLYNLPSLVWMFILSGAAAYDTSVIITIFALIVIVSVVIYQVIELGLLDIALSFRDGSSPQIGDLFRQYPLFLKFLVASIIYSMMVFFGLMLLMVPGIYLALKYQLYGYIIVDRGLGPIEALKESSRMTAGAIMSLFVFWLALGGGMFVIMIILMIFFAISMGLMAGAISPDLVAAFYIVYSFVLSLIGALVILPIIKLATADIYRRLEERLAALTATSTASSVPASEEVV